MTFDQLNMITYYRNSAKLTNRERAGIDGIVMEAILHGDSIDIQEMMRRYGGVNEDIVRFLQEGDFPSEIGAEELYRRYTVWSKHPVSMTKFGREVKAMGVGYSDKHDGVHYYFKQEADGE